MTCTDHLIPALFALFKNLGYLQSLVDCVKLLTELSRWDTLFPAISKKLTSRERSDEVIIQVPESEYRSQPDSLEQLIHFGWRQLFIFAMRYHCKIPKMPKRTDIFAKGVLKQDCKGYCETV